MVIYITVLTKIVNWKSPDDATGSFELCRMQIKADIKLKCANTHFICNNTANKMSKDDLFKALTIFNVHR